MDRNIFKDFNEKMYSHLISNNKIMFSDDATCVLNLNQQRGTMNGMMEIYSMSERNTWLSGDVRMKCKMHFISNKKQC